MTQTPGKTHDFSEPPADEFSVMARCSAIQERFWRLDSHDRGSPALNIVVKWHIRGHLDASIAQEALQAIVERHEALRTSIQMMDRELIQIIADHVPFKLSEIDLSTLSNGDRMAEADHISEQEACRRFDITARPLLRATLVRLSRSEAILLVTLHHIIGDGWSMGLIAKEFVSAYQAFNRGRKPSWPDLPLQYADYAEWCREDIAGGGRKREMDYWQHKLTDLPHIAVPPDRERPAFRSADGASISRLIPHALTTGLTEIARSEGATFFAAAYTVLLILLHQRTGADDIVVSTQMAGRDEVEIETIIGPFVNTVILRTQIEADQSFTNLCRAARDTFEEAVDHPMDCLGDINIPASKRRRSDIPISVNFIVQRAFIGELANDSFQLTGIPSPIPGALYDLNFVLVERKEGWRLTCEYHRDLYDEATAQGLVLQYEELLEAALSSPDIALSLLKTADREPSVAPATEQSTPRAAMRTLEIDPSAMRCGWLQKQGTQPVLFALNHTAQNLSLYRGLSQALGQDQPVVALQLMTLGRESEAPTSIEELAAVYCEAVIRSMTQDTCRIIGFCRSGVIAFEVARQLLAAGYKVDYIALIDCWAPGYFMQQPYRARLFFRLRRVGRFANRVRRAGPRLFAIRMSFWLRSTQAVRNLRQMLHWGSPEALADEADFWRATDDLEALVQRYRPSPYVGRTILFRSDAIPPGWPPDVKLGWTDYVPPGVHYLAIPGEGHEGAFSDLGSRIMADRIKTMIAVGEPAWPI